MTNAPNGHRAIVVGGIAHNGKPCRVVDNTASASEERLRELLAALIRERCFGYSLRSRGGENTIAVDGPEFCHVQLGDRLYRLIVRRYEARLEAF